MRRLRPFCASLALLFGLLLGGAGSASHGLLSKAIATHS
jgi:hypothetical protein